MNDGHTLPIPAPPQSQPEEAFEPSEAPVRERLEKALGEGYELGPQIGQGGMGIVFRATDLRLKREVAIKVLPPEVSSRADLRKRFVREAQLAASLTHPHIVPIYDVGQRLGLAWIVMAYIHGESVRDLIRRSGAQPSHVTAKILREVAWALSYAHARGVVHRDIKPDNIMLDRASGRAIVMDFGLAKVADEETEDEHLTQPGKVLGTPAYMSPEQARGKEAVDNRTDLYSLGMVGYHLLTGRNPFDASSPQGILARVITEKPPDIGNARPDAPEWLADTIRHAMERQRDKRFEHAEQMAEALDRGGASREIPTSVQSLLDLAEGYVQISVIAAWLIYIIGIPQLPNGTLLILAAFFVTPFLAALQLINAQGLTWPEIREGLVARRLHWLRSLSLKREAGLHYPSIIVFVVAVAGVFVIRFSDTLVSLYVMTYDWWIGDYQQFTELKRGPFETGDLLFRGPIWALAYAFAGSVFWAWLFGLPLSISAWLFGISPHKLDAVTSWRMPFWMDLLGQLGFRRVGSTSRIIEATSDFGQLADPAAREAVAFIRTRRNLPWRLRWGLRKEICYGGLAVKRLWWTNEKLQSLRNRARTYAPAEVPAKLAGSIERREAIVTECAAALGGLRVMLEEASSPQNDSTESNDHVVQELYRLTGPLRRIRIFNRVYMTLWTLGVIVGAVLSRHHVRIGPALPTTLFYGLLFIILFQLFKRRLYA